MHFVGDRQAEQDVLAAQPLHLGNRERGSDIDARVVRVAERGVVVEVEIADGQRVQEGGLLGRRLPAAADDRGLRVAALLAHHLGGNSDWLAVDGADCAAERVEQQTFGLRNDVRGKVLVTNPARTHDARSASMLESGTRLRTRRLLTAQ